MSDVTIYSATKLTKSNENDLTSFAQKTFGDGTVTFALDPELIAGIRIVAKDKQIELSLSDLLEKMGQSLS